MIQPCARLSQNSNDLKAGGNAGDAVESSSGRHGIAVRSDRDDAKRGIAAPDPADQVAGRIDTRCEPSVSKALLEPGATFNKERGERTPCTAPCRLGSLCDRHHICPEAIMPDLE